MEWRGNRPTPDGWFYHVSGLDAVERLSKNGRKRRISKDKTVMPAAAIREFLASDNTSRRARHDRLAPRSSPPVRGSLGSVRFRSGNFDARFRICALVQFAGDSAHRNCGESNQRHNSHNQRDCDIKYARAKTARKFAAAVSRQVGYVMLLQAHCFPSPVCTERQTEL